MLVHRKWVLLAPGCVGLCSRSFSSSSDRPPRSTCSIYGRPKKNDSESLQCTREDGTDGSRHYLYRDNGGNVLYSFPSVTTILNSTRSTSDMFRMKVWTKGQIEKYGIERFKANRLRIINEGKAFHAEIADFLANNSSSSFTNSNTSEYFNSIRELLINDITDVKLCEENVLHEELGYAGTVDCLAKYK